MSEHEGFCVPLLEAMAADVPVLAYASTAVPETLGGAGVLFEPKDMEYAAELLGQLAFDPVVRARVIAGQRRRLAEFSDDRLRARLAEIVREAGALSGEGLEAGGWRRERVAGTRCWRGRRPCRSSADSAFSRRPSSRPAVSLTPWRVDYLTS